MLLIINYALIHLTSTALSSVSSTLGPAAALLQNLPRDRAATARVPL